MSRAEATPRLIQCEIASRLHRSMFETLQDAERGVSVDFDVSRDAWLAFVKCGDFKSAMLIDRDAMSWSLDDIFRRYTLDDMLFHYWSRGLNS